MRLFHAALILSVTLVPSAGNAQSAAPIATALRESAEEQGRNLVAAAEVMPGEKYGFKPTPAQMSFGEMVLHVAGGSVFLCATIGGKERPTWPRLAATAPKDTLVTRLRAAFEFCGTALAALDDAKLSEMVPYFGGQQASRARAVLDLAADWADHYSQAAIYLRLNGLLPPTARPQ